MKIMVLLKFRYGAGIKKHKIVYGLICFLRSTQAVSLGPITMVPVFAAINYLCTNDIIEVTMSI
jgi:hypothetical protein